MKTTNADRIVDDFKETLVVIPCSGRKASSQETYEAGPSILDDLPAQLAERLVEARHYVAKKAALELSHLMPAYKRYNGYLYEAMVPTLGTAIERGYLPHLLVLSGGYGILRAEELIGFYNRKLAANDWPGDLIHAVLAAYAQKHRLRRARLFATGTSPYATVLRKAAPWVRYDVTDVLLFTPERISRAGAQLKAPRALGQGLAAMLRGTFDDSWRSIDALTLHSERLS
jgi:hypothetical protein